MMLLYSMVLYKSNWLTDHGVVMDASCAPDLFLVSCCVVCQLYSLSHYCISSVNKSLKGKWASLACHETGSLVVQVSFIACIR